MKKNQYLVNLLHILIVGMVCLAAVIVRAVCPGTVFAHISIPMLVLLTLIPMVLKFRFGENEKKNWMISTLIGGITFTVLPLCAGWELGMPVWELLIAGTAVFGITDILFSSLELILTSGPCGRFAPETNALILYLASQCLQGLI